MSERVKKAIKSDLRSKKHHDHEIHGSRPASIAASRRMPTSYLRSMQPSIPTALPSDDCEWLSPSPALDASPHFQRVDFPAMARPKMPYYHPFIQPRWIFDNA